MWLFTIILRAIISGVLTAARRYWWRRYQVASKTEHGQTLDELWGWAETESEAEVVEALEANAAPESAEFPLLLPSASVEEVAEAYWAEAKFLAECWRWLMQTGKCPNETTNQPSQNVKVRLGPGPEWACLATGMRIDGARTLTQVIPVRYAHQSFSGVAIDPADFHRALRSLQHRGYSLHAIFHSHRFNGPARPSQIDLDTQQRLLEPTYPAIQAVFSEDGYVRFFSVARPFTVQVFGQGVEHVEDTLYRLDEGLREAILADAIWTSPTAQ